MSLVIIYQPIEPHIRAKQVLQEIADIKLM